MTESIATLLISLLGMYVGIGLLFGIVFVIRGAARIDPQAVGASWGFRLAILPGVAVFWPLLARRWVVGRPAPEERNAHRRAARSGER